MGGCPMKRNPVFIDGRKHEDRKYKERFGADHYLPYKGGAGYALTADLVAHIVETRVAKYYPKNEDVAVGLWLAPLNINSVDASRAAIPCFTTPPYIGSII